LELGNLSKKLIQILNRYKYVLLVFSLGLALMLFPGKVESVETVKNEDVHQITSVHEVCEQLTEILSNVSGAGRTQVMLSIRQGEKTIYQTDTDISKTDAANDSRSQTVTVADADRNQTGLVQQVNPPTYMGAIVLCQGADVPSVRLAIVDAVSKLTGLGANQISVLKMK
jgi:stage III sporulation protein AG